MAVNWKNLIQIKCNKIHYQHQLTVLDQLNKFEHYTMSALLAIRQCVKLGRKPQILPLNICKNIRHLRILRRRTRGERAGKSSPPPGEPTGVIRVNLTPVQLNKDVKINRSKSCFIQHSIIM